MPLLTRPAEETPPSSPCSSRTAPCSSPSSRILPPPSPIFRISLIAFIQFLLTCGHRSFSSILCLWLLIGHPMHPMRFHPSSYSSQCLAPITSRNVHTSSSVHSIIGEISRLSLPLIQPSTLSPSALVIFTSL